MDPDLRARHLSEPLHQANNIYYYLYLFTIIFIFVCMYVRRLTLLVILSHVYNLLMAGSME